MVEFDTAENDVSERVVDKLDKLYIPTINTPNRYVKNGFANIGTADASRIVLSHPDVPDVVFKIAPNGVKWANDREKNITLDQFEYGEMIDVPDEIHDLISLVLDWQESDTDGTGWIAMERADTEDVTKDDARYLFKKLNDVGWGVEDLHENNIGKINGSPVVIDYAYMKPIRLMEGRFQERIEDGVVTVAWGEDRETVKI